MGQSQRFRLDDLRRYATDLGTAAGLAPERAATLAGHRLWYDTAGFPALGLSRLPETLDLLATGAIDPTSEVRISHEHPATAVIDGRQGVPTLVLARAAAIAAEKAREIGVGVVRVGNIRPLDAAAEIVAELAVGPTVALALGPRPSWSLALPTADGLPLVLDTSLASGERQRRSRSRPAWVETLGPWASILTTDDGWLILALAVTALEPLATFHERLASTLSGRLEEKPGALLPSDWERHRRDAREHGLALDASTADALRAHAERLGVTPLG